MLITLYFSTLNNDENKIKNQCNGAKKIEGMKGYENRDAPPKFTS